MATTLSVVPLSMAVLSTIQIHPVFVTKRERRGAVAYGSETAVATNITDDISSLADGSVTLCAVGRDTAGNWQSTATTTTWTKDTAAPDYFFGLLQRHDGNAGDERAGVRGDGTNGD